MPAELIDTITSGPARQGARPARGVYRDAGVGTLLISPVAFDADERRRMVRELAEML